MAPAAWHAGEAAERKTAAKMSRGMVRIVPIPSLANVRLI